MADVSQLLVLMSILYGLAIARYFDRNSTYLYSRKRVKMDWLIPGWSLLAFLFMARSWWSYANDVDAVDITYIEYLDSLFLAVILYIQASLLTPDLPEEGKLDLKAHYIKVAPWFFGSILFIFVEKQVLRLLGGSERFFGSENFVRLIFIACLIFMMFNKKRGAHIAMVFVSAALYFSFVVIMDLP